MNNKVNVHFTLNMISETSPALLFYNKYLQNTIKTDIICMYTCLILLYKHFNILSTTAKINLYIVEIIHEYIYKL